MNARIQEPSGKRMLADVLWEAANTWLAFNQPNLTSTLDPEAWSCNAAMKAEFPEWRERIARRIDYHSIEAQSKAVRFLVELGCPKSMHSAFTDFPQGQERQGVRYMWLLLAACVAEDEGVAI